MLLLVSKAVRLLEALAEWLVVGIVIVLLCIVASQVIDRHVVDVPLQAPDQLARIGIVWLTFIGFALALRAGSNIRIDLLDSWLPPIVRRVLAILFDLAVISLLALLIVKGLRIVEVGAMQDILGTPFTAALPNAGLVVGAVLMAIFSILRLVRTVLDRNI